ncbi:MAG: exosortase U [Planctomycetota bacterium]
MSAVSATSTAVPGSSSSSAGWVRWLPLAALIAASAALGPLWVSMVGKLWDSPRFGHAPLVWLAAAWLAWSRLKEERLAVWPFEGAPRPVAEAIWWSIALLSAGAAVWLWTPWLGLAAGFLMIPAAIYSLGGWQTLQPVLPAWATLWVTLPIPFNGDQALVLRLQQIAAEPASMALDMMGRRHLPAGVTVELPGRSYFVEEACSGVNSLYALLAVTALAMVWAKRGWPRWVIILPMAAVWAVVANAARVTAAVELSAGYDLPVLEGLGHDILGAITFAVAAGLTLSTDTMLALIIPPRASKAEREADAAAENAPSDGSPAGGTPTKRLPALPRALVWGGVAGLLFTLGGYQFANAAGREKPIVSVPETLKPTAENSLPEVWNGWRRVAFDQVERSEGHIDGAYSSIWTYRRGSLQAAISMDGPFAEGWHDLQMCYTNGGWTCTDAVDRVITEEKEGPRAGDIYTRLDLEKPLGRRGVVFFTSYAMDDDENLGPNLAARASLMTFRFEQLRQFVDSPEGGSKPEEPGYQVQAYAPSYRSLSEEDVEAVRELFDEMRVRLAALPSEPDAENGSASAPSDRPDGEETAKAGRETGRGDAEHDSERPA